MVVIMACGFVAADRSKVPPATLWYLNYGFDYWTGECVGGVESTAWERPSERRLTPEAGWYCSGDEEYIKQSLREMRRAGISVVILSWNGWGDIDFDGEIEAPDFVAVDKTIDLVFKNLGKGMQAAILVEPYYNLRMDLEDVLPEYKQENLDRVWAHYERYPDKVFYWDDKPLVVTFWPDAVSHWSLGDVGDDRFTYRQWGVLGLGADWEMTALYGLDGMKIGRDGMIWIYPRFDNSGIWEDDDLELVRLDPDLDEGLYDQAWERVFDNRDSVKMIGVYCWNSWVEMASIEPTIEYGDTLIEKTQWYYNRFVHGKKYRLYSDD